MSQRRIVIEQLKKFREEGAQINLPLTSSTDRLRDALSHLLKQESPPKLQINSPSSINENLLGLVLAKLTTDTIFRLYQKSSMVRRLVEKQSFWKALIERDWGLS